VLQPSPSSAHSSLPSLFSTTRVSYLVSAPIVRTSSRTWSLSARGTTLSRRMSLPPLLSSRETTGGESSLPYALSPKICGKPEPKLSSCLDPPLCSSQTSPCSLTDTAAVVDVGAWRVCIACVFDCLFFPVNFCVPPPHRRCFGAALSSSCSSRALLLHRFRQHGEAAQRGVRQQGGVRFGGWLQLAGAWSQAGWLLRTYFAV